MIRLFDFIFSLLGILILSPIMLVLLVIGWFDTRSPVFIQTRVGRNQKPFKLIKFRTMAPSTAQVATHLVNKNSVTPYGAFLRRTKLDELPQLINVLLGQMSLVGPRPNLFNQEELIAERQSKGVYLVRPGITGLAQINEVDMSTPELLAKMDADMIQSLNISHYFKYIILTVSGRGSGDRVKQ